MAKSPERATQLASRPLQARVCAHLPPFFSLFSASIHISRVLMDTGWRWVGESKRSAALGGSNFAAFPPLCCDQNELSTAIPLQFSCFLGYIDSIGQYLMTGAKGIYFCVHHVLPDGGTGDEIYANHRSRNKRRRALWLISPVLVIPHLKSI